MVFSVDIDNCCWYNLNCINMLGEYALFALIRLKNDIRKEWFLMNNNESTIKFSDLFYLFISKLWIMILVAVIIGGSIFAFKYATYTPLYKSTGSIYILRQGADSDESDYNSDFSLALSVVSDCTKLLTSRTVLNQVIADNSLTYEYYELMNMISITNPSNTRYLEISVMSDSPEKSKMIVDSICAIGKEQIVSVMGFNQVNIVDEGTLPTDPANSKYTYDIIIGALVGFVLTYIIFALIFIFDDRISDPDLVEKYLDLSVLALIPNMKKDKSDNNAYMYQGKTATQRRRYYSQGWKE